MVPLLVLLRNPQHTYATAAGAAAIVALTAFAILRRRPTPEQIEAKRRDRLAIAGRIVDGSLLDAYPSLAAPNVLVYSYRIAGVTYECSQNVSTLASYIQGHDLEEAALDLPIQVRYDRANPGDSIVIADAWNGLWSVSAQPSGLHIKPRKPSY